MAGNFIPMVYAVLKDKGVDTSKMTTEQAVEKYNELLGKTGRYDAKTGDKAEEREKLEKRYNSDMASGIKRDVKKIPQAIGFNRPKTKHHLRHAQEMGLNEKEYIRRAILFFNSKQGNMYFSEARKRFYKYNKETKELAVASEVGIIHTYQFCTEKRFFRTKEQDNLWEIK